MNLELWGSALFAGLVAIGVTLAIERFGGRAGGLIGTMPSTIVPASIGFHLSSSPEAAREALLAVPFGMAVNVLFLWSWAVLPPRITAPMRLTKVLAGALSIWAVAALGCTLLLDTLPVDLAGPATVMTLTMILVGAWACRGAPPSPPGRRKVGLLSLVSRGWMAAGAIALAVWLSDQSPLLAGMASVFPAIFLTTMVSLWISQGEAVQAGAVGPMMLGSTAVSVYALLATLSLPHLGLVWGSVVAWKGSLIFATLPAWWWVQRHPAVPRAG